MNLIYHEIVFFIFHSRHIRKLITLSFPLAWEGLLIYMTLPYDQFKIVLYIYYSSNLKPTSAQIDRKSPLSDSCPIGSEHWQ